MNERIVVDVEANAQKFNQGISGVIQKLGGPGTLAIAGAAAAAGAAIAAFSVKGVQAFAQLETGMNEVFTLMPGMTEDAMGSMTQDVQDFAVEMGVLPDDIVPALYDSISAGVPKENVFDFLATANELAIGGVSDLNTAVDGLTSATNAYGTDLLSASDAADIMFTGVKQGKTTIDELSRTVSETAPIAASLGVSFVDTTAALSAMTSQGEPSQKAATKLRQMMAELSDATKGAGKTLQAITGEDFPAFIAGGGTMQEAIELIADDAEKHGGRVQDEFGSIEAGMAATMLVSTTGREKMNENMAAMGDAAGATDAAFETMDQGIARTWERMKASLASFMTEIGERLGPGVTKILGKALEGFNTFAEGTLAFLDRVMGDWDGTWESIAGETDSTVARILNIGKALWTGISAAFDVIVAAWNNVLMPMWDIMGPTVMTAVDMVLSVVETSLNAVAGVLEMVAALLSGDFSGAWDAAKTLATDNLDGIQEAARLWWKGVKGTFDKMVTFVNTILDTMFGDLFRMGDKSVTDLGASIKSGWDGMLGTMRGVMPDMIGEARHTWDTMSRLINEAVQNDRTALSGAWDGIKAVLTEAWGIIQTAAENVFASIRASIESAFNGLGDYVRGVFSGVVDAIGGILDGIASRISSAVEAVTGLFNRTDRAEERAREAAAASQEAIDAIDTSIGEIDPVFQNDPLAPNPDSGLDIDPTILTPDDLADRGGLPEFATGGLVTSATLALIGEAGPEAVVPLDRLGGMGGGSQTIIVELDGRTLLRSVAPRLVDELRLKTGIAGL